MLPENLSASSMKLIKRHVGGRQKSSTRVEIISPDLFKQAAAHRAISSFFDKNAGDEGRSEDNGEKWRAHKKHLNEERTRASVGSGATQHHNDVVLQLCVCVCVCVCVRTCMHVHWHGGD